MEGRSSRGTAQPRTPFARQMPPFQNRFAISGVATGRDFTDRAQERTALRRAVATPGSHVLLTGHRRIGKTSLLLAAQADAERDGTPVIFADLWSATTIEDITTRLVRAAAQALGRNWQELIAGFASRLRLTFAVDDTTGGMLVPIPSVEFRDAPPAVQVRRLIDALDWIETLATTKRTAMGIILDEFQEIDRLGGRTGETMRNLRAAIQLHTHVTYILSGSDRRLIQQLTRSRGGALHNFGRQLALGPIPVEHFAPWIEGMFATMGMKTAPGLGAAIIAVAGPRTRDVRTLAGAVTDLCHDAGVARVTPDHLEAGMRRVLIERTPTYEAAWHRLTAQQQNVLRATAVSAEGLTRQATREQFALGDTSRVVKALAALAAQDILLREGSAWVYDDPFLRAWVLDRALPDVAPRLPLTHNPLRPPG